MTANKTSPRTRRAALSDDEMYQRMVSAMLDHRLPPGTKLVEDRLAAAFGVSRTRVRPVLVRLANEQVVRLTPHRGACIAQPTPQEAQEVFETRRLLEPRLVELFIAHATAADIAALRACTDDEESARTRGDMRRAIRLSGDFHLRIAQAAGQRTLERILRELVSRTSLILMSYSPIHAHAREEATVCGCREHRALIDAIRLRDPREAGRLMRAHLLRIETRLDFTPAPGGAPDLVALLGQAA
ncbi:GntR family transcriptional regulator [Verminephrobacter aporrectodeae subsp. tuberculatae]|uniref:GntR family transcriptional regulator n=1 Tax=Verminephrobacter aporrectodeae subsp. tuberculatae TaxID=1110392 RepID=A0ABT3KSD8_9BURK|nr:GntR family transcriptional regulator [Verminephrobacter aporrectodeae]MCW5321175.1 GntR family transcriptional regulator [Verminephrobacter aporrectodeae subsp. tuberculatae]